MLISRLPPVTTQDGNNEKGEVGMKALTKRQQAFLSAVLAVGSIALTIWMPNPFTFLVLMTVGLGGTMLFFNTVAE